MTSIVASEASHLGGEAASGEAPGRDDACFDSMVDRAGVGLVQCDRTGRIVAVNGSFCDLVGRNPDTLIGEPIASLIHPDDLVFGNSAFARLLATGEAITVEKRLVRPGGGVVWVRHHIALTSDPSDPKGAVIIVCQDVTGRRKAEPAAHRSAERMSLALGAGVILGTWVWSADHDRLSGDARFAAVLSLNAQEVARGLPAAAALAAVHPQDTPAVLGELRGARDHGGPFRAEFRLRQPDGGWLWVEANGESEVGGGGTRLSGILINIDQRRAAAERQTFLVELSDQIRTIDDPDRVMAKVVEATGRHLRAGRVGYGEVSPDGGSVSVRAGWTREGAAFQGRLPTTLLGEDAQDRLQAGAASLVSRSIIDDAPAAVVSVPLLRDGRWHAVMFAADAPDRTWSQSDADVLREALGRTWEAVERARAVITLRKAQSRQAFLLRLNDHLSEIHDPKEVLETVAEALGSFLKAGHVGYGEVALEAATITIEGGWSDGSVRLADGAYSYASVADAEIAEMARGLTVSEDDLRVGKLDPHAAERLTDAGVRAFLAVPLIHDGRLRAGLFLSHAAVRHWSLEEISLTQEVARRTWDALERTRAELALQRSEARLRAMFDTLPVGIVFAEMPSGQVTEGNARVEQILGPSIFSPDHDHTSEWMAFDEAGHRVPIEDHPLYIAVTTGEPATRVFHHQRGDGSRVWVSVIGAPVRDAEGRITGGLVTIVDVDREKKAGEALRELNATLEQQIEQRTRERDRAWRNSHDLLAVMGIDGVLRAVNPSWTALLGRPSEALVGRRFDQFMHPDDVAPTMAAIEHLRIGPLAAPFENRYSAVDGRLHWFSWTASLEDDVVYANGRDVTAEKEQAEALRQAEEQLRQSQKMEAVGQLTGGIAHDFNNLLTGITGALDLLGKRIGQGRLENVERYINMAMTSANRAASLTHRLLAFSRRQPLEAKPVDANRLVTSMDDLLRRTLGEKITLDIDLAASLWLTLCDPHQLENAVLNLVINARDAMPDGGRLTVKTSNATVEGASEAREVGIKPGRYIEVAVSDTGTGMSADVIARAFDPFFTTKPIGQGTGLGLSMIYGFAKQSEGTVRIDSVEGQGTTVTLYLPRSRGEFTEQRSQRGGTPAAAGAGETVLIVEDDATVRELALEVLRDLGYDALEAHDGPSGLQIIDSDHHIDLLITDVGLPGINGRQLADRAKQIRPTLRVLFITGYAENATFGSGMVDEGMQMITKPFAIETLAAKIKEMIGS